MENEKKENILTEISRRNFVTTLGTATVGFTILPRHVLGGPGYTAPSDLLNIAGIGVGGRGRGNITSFSDPEVLEANAKPSTEKPIKLANIYALADVDTARAARLVKGFPKAKFYTDWRELLEKEKSIDGVVISTPDHTHAVITSAFIRAKKHVYVEKPLTKTIHEARKLAELAKEYNIVSQMGNQGRAEDGSRQTVEWIRSGAIGKVREVHATTDRPVWPQGDLKRPAAVALPDTLNYDMWLGPAPEKPYGEGILPFNWRGLWDYGTGALGDMGAHILDVPIWALDLGLPASIQATSTPYSADYLPQGQWVTYEFAARGKQPAVKVLWVDGGLRPPLPKEFEKGRKLNRDGYAIYYGDKGIIIHGSHGAAPQLIPANPDFKGPKPWLTRTKNIYEDWIDAIKNGTKASSDFSVSAKLTEILLLANIAVRHQDKNIVLEYDGVNGKITNLPEANDLLHYEYRKGWTL